MKSTTHLILTCLLSSILISHVNAQLPADYDQAVHQRIAAKVERIKAGVHKMIESGTDPSAIAKTMSGKVAPLLDSGKFTEAEPVLDSVLKSMGLEPETKNTSIPADSPEAMRQRIMAKMERVKEGAQKMADGGNDPSDILRTMEQKFKPLIDTGKAIEAEAVLDGALKALGLEPDAGSPAAPKSTAGAPSGQLDEATRKRLTEKVERVKAGAHKWAEGGRDPSVIGHAMEAKFKPLMEAGKIVEAEAELDLVLEQLSKGPQGTASPASSTETVHQRVAAKIELIKTGARKLAEGGTDPSAILTTMQEKVGPLLDAGRLLEAEPELDRVLAQLKPDGKSTDSPPAPAKTSEKPPAPADTVHLRIVTKIERLKASAKKAAADGAAPSAILKTTQEKLGPLIEAGKFAEAEAELDRVLSQLNPDSK